MYIVLVGLRLLYNYKGTGDIIRLRVLLDMLRVVVVIRYLIVLFNTVCSIEVDAGWRHMRNYQTDVSTSWYYFCMLLLLSHIVYWFIVYYYCLLLLLYWYDC